MNQELRIKSKKWEIIGKLKTQNSKVEISDLLKVLLKNRGINTKKEIGKFLNPKLEAVSAGSVGIDKEQLQKALKRIKKAIRDKEEIVVYGDYDVDGICGAAIVWETLYGLGAKVMPYIPHRMDEGYGLSVKGIENCKLKIENCSLIITVDNGIVASKAVDFANKNGIDVIITDHHVSSKKLPRAYSIVHTTKLCGAGVAYLLSREISKFKFQNSKTSDTHLELVALATVADLVLLTGANRTLLKFGLERLRKTKRPGLLEIFKEGRIDKDKIGVYEIGHIIAPRLNAMGRLEHAMDSLRILCTNNAEKAGQLARRLGLTNRERQQMTKEAVQHAVSAISYQVSGIKKLIFVGHEDYQQGVIGLVAGKLVEEFYRPSIVVSIGKRYSKASARSVSGFNIIEFIRGASDLLIDAGGHPMAAGFTVETEKLSLLRSFLEKRSQEVLDSRMLTRTLKIDLVLPLGRISQELYNEIQKLSPFGMGNPEPTFMSENVMIEDMRTVGEGGKHLKIKVKNQRSKIKGQFDGIGFGMGERMEELRIGDKADIIYAIDENRWNGKTSLQLKIKDIKRKAV
ncbi:single-stranded-DNA-specific exonuclease RecJ [Patescibacteria group bacterium]|nr:single-stranded-DNA-specific exonuclease RecJ [Patescibacteria group bacterium]MCL5010104.1 single-stranded-DNA-specific exonuclease RecJ [Patescibacteria group bacterium]